MPEKTVRLSERRPVRIEADDWPIVASSTAEDGYDTITTLYVRRHEDGRGLIYYEFTNSAGEDQGRAGGELVEGIDDDDFLATELRRVAGNADLDDQLVGEVLSSLSPEDLT